MRTTTFSALAGVLLAMSGTVPLWAGAAGDLPNEHRVLARFDRAVGRYVELHRRLEAGLPALTVTADAEQTRAAVDQFAAAVRTERGATRVGTIFEPDVALLIRRRLHDAVGQGGRARLPGVLDPRVPMPMAVNEPFPWHVPNAMWPWALDVLPRVAWELEYRFVGYDLVLLDVDANLIVDILPAALPIVYPIG
jgi:hypothetical protein